METFISKPERTYTSQTIEYDTFIILKSYTLNGYKIRTNNTRTSRGRGALPTPTPEGQSDTDYTYHLRINATTDRATPLHYANLVQEHLASTRITRFCYIAHFVVKAKTQKF